MKAARPELVAVNLDLWKTSLEPEEILMEIARQPLIPVTLKGGNYLLWSQTVKTALCSHGLWNHIDGHRLEDEGSTPEASTEGRKWFQEDQTVLAIIQSSLEASVLEDYSYCDSAKELWETLKNVFGNISNISRIFEVKKAISNLQQEEEFTKHFGEFRALWTELEELRPLTIDPKELQERHDEDQVFALHPQTGKLRPDQAHSSSRQATYLK